MPAELLIPRKKIDYLPINDGRVVDFAGNLPLELTTPHVGRDCKGEGDVLQGFESGGRSGLVTIGNDTYKIKGSRPQHGQFSEGSPYGSQLLSVAEREAERVSERREAFLREGIEYPLEPHGLWIYDSFRLNGEPNAATIYKADGDTRLDEVLWNLDQVPYALLDYDSWVKLADQMAKIGYTTGQLLKLFHGNNFSWDADRYDNFSNVHIGNIVLFKNSRSEVGLAMVDFDSSTSYLPQDDPQEVIDTVKEAQAADYNKLQDNLMKRTISSYGYPVPLYITTLVESELVGDVVSELLPHLSNADQRDVIERLINVVRSKVSWSPRESVRNGFVAGYENRDKTTTVPWSDLEDIPNLVKNLQDEAKERVGEAINTMTTLQVFAASKYSNPYS